MQINESRPVSVLPDPGTTYIREGWDILYKLPLLNWLKLVLPHIF